MIPDIYVMIIVQKNSDRRVNLQTASVLRNHTITEFVVKLILIQQISKGSPVKCQRKKPLLLLNTCIAFIEV